MIDADNEKSRLVDGLLRDKRGFWQPERGTAPPSPLFAWPPRPTEAFKWLFGFPGYLLSLIHISQPTRRTPSAYAVF